MGADQTHRQACQYKATKGTNNMALTMSICLDGKGQPNPLRKSSQKGGALEGVLLVS